MHSDSKTMEEIRTLHRDFGLRMQQRQPRRRSSGERDPVLRSTVRAVAALLSQLSARIWRRPRL